MLGTIWWGIPRAVGTTETSVNAVALATGPCRPLIISDVVRGYLKVASNKENKMECKERGRGAEQQFEAMCRRHGWRWRKATPSEDAQEHWDYLVQRGSREQPERIEVKSEKKLKRSDREPSRTFTWLEWEGVPRADGTSNAGWLYGRADYIAFQSHSADGQLGFLLCKRTECLALAQRCAATAVVYSSGPLRLHQLYARQTRGAPRGTVILVKLTELAALPDACFI